MQPPKFSDDFRRQFRELLAWRRDVRRFRRQPIDPVIFDELLGLACLAPSVGNSQPWRFVLVEDPVRRERIRDIFGRCNDAARATYAGTRAALYGQLKLAGLQEAPCHLAVFVDEATAAGHGLGRHTMPEMLHYSAVAAVQTLWLAGSSSRGKSRACSRCPRTGPWSPISASAIPRRSTWTPSSSATAGRTASPKTA